MCARVCDRLHTALLQSVCALVCCGRDGGASSERAVRLVPNAPHPVPPCPPAGLHPQTGATALHRATEHGHAAVVVALIAAGADVDAANRYIRTPLHLAAARGDAETVDALLAAGADPRHPDTKRATPLHIAAEFDTHARIAQALLAAGAHVDAKNLIGRTPLLVAAASIHASVLMARTLLAAGADRYARDHARRDAEAIAAAAQDDTLADFVRNHHAAGAPAGRNVPQHVSQRSTGSHGHSGGSRSAPLTVGAEMPGAGPGLPLWGTAAATAAAATGAAASPHGPDDTTVDVAARAASIEQWLAETVGLKRDALAAAAAAFAGDAVAVDTVSELARLDEPETAMAFQQVAAGAALRGVPRLRLCRAMAALAGAALPSDGACPLDAGGPGSEL